MASAASRRGRARPAVVMRSMRAGAGKNEGSDTGGANDHVFALCHLLGFRFVPHLRDFQDYRLANEGAIVAAQPDYLSAMIDLNVRAVTRLTAAIAPHLAAAGAGTIINITSVTALMPEAFTAVYPASKAFVLAFTEALRAELGPQGVRVQAVLPGVTRTPIWSDEAMAGLPPEMVMEAGDMVDAALSGLDMDEGVTIPSLPDSSAYHAFVAARTALHPQLSLSTPAARYGVPART